MRVGVMMHRIDPPPCRVGVSIHTTSYAHLNGESLKPAIVTFTKTKRVCSTFVLSCHKMRPISICTVLLLSTVAAFFAAPPSPCSLVVPAGSPLSSARSFVADTLAASGGHLDADLVICLGAGVHDVSTTPLHLASEHSPRSGTGRVVWRTAPGAAASATVSGGAQVTGWVPTTLGGGAVYAAPVPPAVAAAGTVVRQLWVGGARASRTVLTSPTAALHGMSLWTSPTGAVGYTVGAVPDAWLFNGTTSLEFTYPIVLQNWVSPRCTVASIDATPPAPPHKITGPFAGVSVVSHSNVAPGQSVPGSVQFAGSFDTIDGCIAACVANATCTSYTYHDSSCGAGFAHMCYWRVDGVFEPESGWPGHFSGDKGGRWRRL